MIKEKIDFCLLIKAGKRNAFTKICIYLSKVQRRLALYRQVRHLVAQTTLVRGEAPNTPTKKFVPPWDEFIILREGGNHAKAESTRQRLDE